MEDGDKHSASIVVRSFPIRERGRGQEQVMEWDLERVRPPPARAGEDHRGCYGGADSEAAPARAGDTQEQLTRSPRCHGPTRTSKNSDTGGVRGSEEDPDLVDEIPSWLRSSGIS